MSPEALATQKPSDIHLGDCRSGTGSQSSRFSLFTSRKDAVSVDRLTLANFTVTGGYKPLICINKNGTDHLYREINLSAELECLILPFSISSWLGKHTGGKKLRRFD